jgi:hypothetical protein
LWFDGFFCRIDATLDDGSLARLVNDEAKMPNCIMKMHVWNMVPRLCLFSTKHINEGEELRYSYGCGEYPWRKKV